MPKTTVLFICGEKESYPRNSQILKSLNDGFEVIKITSNKPSYPLRIIEVLTRLAITSLFKDYQLVWAGFLGQPLAPAIRFFTGKPLILDAFVSVYDALCLDRGDFKPGSLTGKIAYRLDALSFRLADKIITDTGANADFFSKLFKIKRDKFYALHMGTDESVFYPRQEKLNNDKFTIFFHGTFWKLHGIDYIIKAAKLLENRTDILFRLLGGGREKKKIVKLAEDLKLKNVEFLDWISYQDLSCRIAESDICLGGHFSGSDKANRVISGKSVQYLAMKKPVIAGESLAAKELFTHAENIYLCARADEKSLAEAIISLKENSALRERIALEGFKLFKDRLSAQETKNRLQEIIAGQPLNDLA